MGDMKTPDFDDLLAAFDIPDIDAKEAIQSAPDETDAPHAGAPVSALGKPDSVVSGGSSLRPPSPPDSQTDTSIVSVIVKNKVRTVDGAEGETEQDPIDVITGVDVGPPGPVGLASPFFPPSKPVLPAPSHPLQSSQPFNGATKGAFQHTPVDDEDSDPDLGSPLVIQETPDSPNCTEPSRKFKSDSTQPSSSQPKPGDTPSGASVSLSMPQSGTIESPAQEDRCSSPAVASTPPPSELREMVDGKGDGDKGENAKVGEEKMDVEHTKSKASEVETNSTPAASGTPSRPLKVRIKTIKTSTGGITRTVTRVASKGGAEKAQSGEHKLLSNKNTKNDPGQVNASSQKVSALNALPVSTLAASSVMLAAATKVQNKMAASEKAKVSATAVSITKSTALPATPAAASTPKFSATAGGISVRTATNKTANGGSGTIIASSLQPSKPASIVNSTGAVISRSQSSLVEAFNKILNSKNLLPSYKPDLSAPPPPEWGLPLPASGYRCLECGDSFALERSLARHYDRRSLRIEVTCNHCAKRLAFFNKCSLLLHAREHKERGLVMQCSHLVMRPVTVEQMIGQQDITLVLAGLSSAAPGSTGDSGPTGAHALPCKKAEGLQYNNFKCPECQTQCNNKTELVTHFQQIRTTSNSVNPILTFCSPPMMLPNSCALSAHQRNHKHKAPHVCPECGGTARQASFQTHLEEACLHFARRIGYRCTAQGWSKLVL
uniref:Zinc finger protein 687b n=1 Tax=Neogobius melanostomus TaxID=47308 RepID=A0A8C6S633_9GOBI